MSSHPINLLKASRRLTDRRRGRPGPLAGAYIRRSISTSYYAAFHFLIEDTTARIMGAASPPIRRHFLSRTFTHNGMKTAMGKVAGRTVNESVQALFQGRGLAPVPIDVPRFARDMAKVFLDGQTKREAADYDLSEKFSADDARALRSRVSSAIKRWANATSAADKDFKHSLAVLLIMKGQVRAGRE